jgi:hypothetical protein
VGADIALGNQAIKGNWALFVILINKKKKYKKKLLKIKLGIKNKKKPVIIKKKKSPNRLLNSVLKLPIILLGDM